MRKLKILVVLLALSSCTPKYSTIKLITSNYPDSTTIYLYNAETEKRDSGYIINNELLFEVNNIKPTLLTLRTDYKKREDFEYISIWKGKSAIEIRAEKGNLRNAEVIGSQIQQQKKVLDDKQKPYKTIFDSIFQLYRNTPREDSGKRKELRKIGMQYEDSIAGLKLTYIKEHPDWFYSAVLLNNSIHNLSKKELEEYYAVLSPNNKSTTYANDVRRYIELNKNPGVGDKAINFKLPNLHGDSISLESFKGKYVLLDFWSSNCGACLIENPLLLKKYNQYKDEGFEILGYCLDKNKQSWEKTVSNYNITWTTVSDLKGTKGDVPLTYNLYVMPTYFMIDRSGFIIAKVEGRRGMEEMIDNTFAGKLELKN